MNNKNYRQEIDGLRAVSVLVIIFFHLKIAAFQGGFIGVDIFFVVSGYLITQIIVSNLGAGSFTFRDFYLRRTARILPALIAMIVFVLPVAMYLQQPAALIHTAQESLYALASVSNFYFWTEANYWAPSADKFVLLHTWSLGVEEQFYLVYPLLLVASHRIGGTRGVITLLLIIFVGGTIASEIVLQTDRSAAFYFTPLRFYEFALGGLAATLPGLKLFQQSRGFSATATLVGIGLILYGAITFHGQVSLPGVTMLVPLVGAVLILLAGPSPSARILLMNPIMSQLGKISYSLYLTHWPIIVFYRAYFGADLSVQEQVALLCVILVASVALNRGVERRFRLAPNGNKTAAGTSSRTVLISVVTAASVAALTCIALIILKGWPSRMPDEARELMNINPMADTIRRMKFLEKNCVPRGEIFCGERQPGKTNILLLGDSRATDIYIALKTAYPEAN
ncbi:MAG: acyltransferase, partial [Halioglobus sp.]|nr:acyltransferase [Halioglobus sp.]